MHTLFLNSWLNLEKYNGPDHNARMPAGCEFKGFGSAGRITACQRCSCCLSCPCTHTACQSRLQTSGGCRSKLSSLIDDVVNRIRIISAAHTVDHHRSHGCHALNATATGLSLYQCGKQRFLVRTCRKGCSCGTSGRCGLTVSRLVFLRS